MKRYFDRHIGNILLALTSTLILLLLYKAMIMLMLYGIVYFYILALITSVLNLLRDEDKTALHYHTRFTTYIAKLLD